MHGVHTHVSLRRCVSPCALRGMGYSVESGTLLHDNGPLSVHGIFYLPRCGQAHMPDAGGEKNKAKVHMGMSKIVDHFSMNNLHP